MPQMTVQQALELAEENLQAGRLKQTESVCRQILAHEAENPVAMHLLVLVHLTENHWKSAMELIRQVIRIDPQSAEPYCTLGRIQASTGQVHDAVESFQHALAIRPEYPEAHQNLATMYLHVGRFNEAIDAYRSVLTQRPDWAIVHHNLGLALLLQGDFATGLPEYEWRLRAPELGIIRQNFPVPRWDGGDPLGRRILLHAEQGFGDTIQFVRYLPMVQQRGGKIILQSQPELTGLLKSMSGNPQIISRTDPLPEFDVHCPLGSLPLVMKTTLDTIPASIPYLFPDPTKAEHWRQRLSTATGLKIGLVWAGLPTHLRDRERSLPLSALAPLAEVKGVSFFSLQLGPTARQALTPPAGMTLIDCSPDLTDFSDTGALMHNLDLIITVDSAAAHLAGALGKPVWVLLSLLPDWRWLLDRDDSPWYPTMRLFRQKHAGDWNEPIHWLVQSLHELANQRKKPLAMPRL